MPAPKIFISYRHEDCQTAAGFLYHLLEKHFGPENIFFDVAAIPMGRNFVEYLDEQVSQCDVLLAVIGKRWLEAKDENGDFRLRDKNDFVRIEIASALKRPSITVVPLLVEGAKIPPRDSLPTILKELPLLQRAQVRPFPDFIKDVDKLVDHLETIEPAKDNPSSDDQAIELAIRFELRKHTGKLSKADLEKIKQLELDHRETNHHPKITDIRALASLGMLEKLYLGKNSITDISALAGLKNLEELILAQNKLNDLTPLTDLTLLEILNLRGNNLQDLSALSKLNKLRRLSLSDNQFTDICALAELKQLEILGLRNNQLDAICTLAELKRLKYLHIQSNNINDVSALSELDQLEVLNLRDNRIGNVCALTKLKYLRKLYLSGNKLNNMSPVAGLKQLKSLHLGGNNIEDISNLSALKNLEQLSLRGNPITDARVLLKLNKLTLLTLRGTNLSETEIDKLRLALPDCTISHDFE